MIEVLVYFDEGHPAMGFWELVETFPVVPRVGDALMVRTAEWDPARLSVTSVVIDGSSVEHRPNDVLIWVGCTLDRALSERAESKEAVPA